jgi:hypothetical protein
MEKKSPLILLISAMAISLLVMPMFGILAQNDNIKNVQYRCCSYIEEEKSNLYTASAFIIEPNLYV